MTTIHEHNISEKEERQRMTVFMSNYIILVRVVVESLPVLASKARIPSGWDAHPLHGTIHSHL